MGKFVPTGYVDEPKQVNPIQEYVEVDYDKIVAETLMAVLVDDGDRKSWVPKSCIEDWGDMNYDFDGGTLRIARWFAEKEEWV